MRLLDGSPLPARRRRPSTQRIAAVEPLEGRALLSGLAAGPHPRPARLHARFEAPPTPSPPGLGTQFIGDGFAAKLPHLNPSYQGPPRGDLNLIEARAEAAPGKNLLLVGAAVDPIHAAPATEAQAAFYTFAINRGSAKGIGPYPGRGNIRFDALVAVAFRPAGPSAAVVDLRSGAVTPLPAASVAVSGRQFRVLVPLALLPSTGFALNHYGVNVQAGLVPPPEGIAAIASFLPDYASFAVLAPHG